MTTPSASALNPYPVTLELERPAAMSRAHVFLRILILIFASWIVGSEGWLGLLYLGLPAAAAILIAQKGGQRYITENGERVTGWIAFVLGVLAYLAFLTDDLPRYGRQYVRLQIIRSGAPTIGSALLRILKAIPSALVLALLGLVSMIVWPIAAIAILIHERYPARLWNFQDGIITRQANLLAYLASLIEPYPPFSLNAPTAAPQVA